jgi:hypothetical protein
MISIIAASHLERRPCPNSIDFDSWVTVGAVLIVSATA